MPQDKGIAGINFRLGIIIIIMIINMLSNTLSHAEQAILQRIADNTTPVTRNY